ncbi:hypothetical protein Hanom_Chr03g00198361 [Helianthus anomalus]
MPESDTRRLTGGFRRIKTRNAGLSHVPLVRDRDHWSPPSLSPQRRRRPAVQLLSLSSFRLSLSLSLSLSSSSLSLSLFFLFCSVATAPPVPLSFSASLRHRCETTSSTE